MLALLIGCDEDAGLDAARERAEDVLALPTRGTAIVQVGVDEPGRVTLTYGDRVGGERLSAWLDGCADVATAFDAEIELEAGGYPWAVAAAEDLPLSDCVHDRLTTFPFEEPTSRNQRDLVRVRWRPAVRTEDRTFRLARAERHLPTPVPPYALIGADGGAIDWASLTVEDATVRYRPRRTLADAVGWTTLVAEPGVRPEPGQEGAAPFAGAATWARALTCPSDTPSLVRTVMVFVDGELDRVSLRPETECVRAHLDASWRVLLADGEEGRALRRADHAVVVFDVPVGAW